MEPPLGGGRGRNRMVAGWFTYVSLTGIISHTPSQHIHSYNKNNE
jgi:hypothetical protein